MPAVHDEFVNNRGGHTFAEPGAHIRKLLWRALHHRHYGAVHTVADPARNASTWARRTQASR